MASCALFPFVNKARGYLYSILNTKSEYVKAKMTSLIHHPCLCSVALRLFRILSYQAKDIQPRAPTNLSFYILQELQMVARCLFY